MPNYKLKYFDGRGRAEVCRLLFALSGQEFEDCRFAMQDWPKIKPTTPFGSAPVLEIDGKPYAQSMALASYLAKEFGYYGKNNMDALQIDQVLGLITDFANIFVKAKYEQDEVKKAELQKNLLTVEIPKYMGFFEKLLKDNGTGYLVGNSLTLADLMVFDFVTNLDLLHPGVSDKYGWFQTHRGKVENYSPRIKAYLAQRKPATF